MAAQELRDYQRRGVSEILTAWRNGARSVLAVAPTGSGKTTVFTHIAACTKGRVLILVHRRELAKQAANRLREFGIDFGYVMAGMPAKPYARVQIASVPTLVKRGKMPRADVVVCDEAHLSTARTWTEILQRYPHSKILGCTATPWRLGGAPLAGTYDASVVIATPAGLRQEGHLSAYIGFSYKAPDLSGVKKVGDDYNVGQSAKAMREPAIVANVVEQWLAHAKELSTVVFACTVEHSQELTAEFKAAGVRAEHLDGGTPLEAREAVLRRVANGETQVLCNVGIAVEGLDIPRLKCCVIARPTMSTARAIQMMGRVRRPWQGVTARIHDHAFVIRDHGLPDAERDYTLEADHGPGDGGTGPAVSQCSKCFAVYEGPSCPACGAEAPPPPPREIITIDDAEKIEFSSDDAPRVNPDDLPPVSVQWNTPGRKVEGVYESKEVERVSFGSGQRNWYVLRGDKRRYRVPGTTQLDQKMGAARMGLKTLVTFTGEREVGGGRKRKEFTVEQDEEAKPEVEDPRWAELEAFYRTENRTPKKAVERRIFQLDRQLYRIDARRFFELREKCRIQTLHSQDRMNDRWEQLEAFYRKYRRYPLKNDPKEAELYRFQTHRLRLESERLHALRKTLKVDKKVLLERNVSSARRLRKSGWSRQRIAVKLGVTPSTVGLWCRGTPNRTPARARRTKRR